MDISILINIQKQNTPLTQLKYYTSSQKARKLTGVLYDQLLYYFSNISCVVLPHKVH